jgi:hypothetical protein
VSDQPMLIYTKLQLAEIQLERALQLFLDEEDYVCAVTLAGAAEELLGKLREKSGGTSELKALIDDCVTAGQNVYAETWPTKLFSKVFTYPRNEFKHIGDGSPIVILRDAVVPIVGRAITNYRELTGKETSRMTKFMAESYGG